MHWNTLRLDPLLPLTEQRDYLNDDAIFVSFPSGCALFVDWMPPFDVNGEFVVTRVQNPDAWRPLWQQRCRSIGQLKSLVRRCVRQARTTPLRYVLGRHNIRQLCGERLEFHNELVFDSTRPLAEQQARLKERLYEAHLESGHVITIGWHPPHDSAGEFVLTLYYDPTVWQNGLKPKSDRALWRVVESRRCRTVAKLRRLVEQLLLTAKRTRTR